MEENKTKYKDVTEDYVYMINAFSCDFNLAVQNKNKLIKLEKDKHDRYNIRCNL